MSEPYRYACPHGHTAIRLGGTGVHQSKHYRCESCKRAGDEYKHTYKVDKKTGREITV